MRQVIRIQNRVHNSGVPAWLCHYNELEVGDDDLYTSLTLLAFLKEMGIGIGEN